MTRIMAQVQARTIRLVMTRLRATRPTMVQATRLIMVRLRVRPRIQALLQVLHAEVDRLAVVAEADAAAAEPGLI